MSTKMNKLFLLLLVSFLCINCPASKVTLINEKYEVTKDTLTDYQVLTDSTVKYPFGYSCSKSGMPPKGRMAIDNLVKNKDYQVIRSVLNGDNDEGKMHAIEALLKLNLNKEIVLIDSEKDTIKLIIERNVMIVRCEGCLYSTTTSRELFNEACYKKLLDKNGIEITAIK